MLAYIFVLLTVAMRFLILHLQPHPWDFTPETASLLFFGANRPRRELWFPVVLFAIADVVLTKVVYSYALGWDQLITWAWYVAAIFLGTRLRNHSKPLWILSTALGTSVLFFLMSNFAVWAGYTMYPKSLSGLIACYAAGIPFFKYRPIGDLVFASLMFGLPVVLSQLSKKSNVAAV